MTGEVLTMGREYPDAPVIAVAAVVLRKEQEFGDGLGAPCSVLLIRRAQPPSMGEWSLPGGVLELGETLRDGVVREIREETGLLVEPVALLEAVDCIVRDNPSGAVESAARHVTKDSMDVRVRFHYVLIEFVCRVQSGVLAVASDALEARWLSRLEFERRDIENGMGFALSGDTVKVIAKALRLVDDGLEVRS
jgi:ADP-ribose pyrophosphatase YjhB (NUDIX family)